MFAHDTHGRVFEFGSICAECGHGQSINNNNNNMKMAPSCQRVAVGKQSHLSRQDMVL